MLSCERDLLQAVQLYRKASRHTEARSSLETIVGVAFVLCDRDPTSCVCILPTPGLHLTGNHTWTKATASFTMRIGHVRSYKGMLESKLIALVPQAAKLLNQMAKDMPGQC